MNRFVTFLFAMIVAGASVVAQEKPAGSPTPAELYGVWSGTWEGMGQNGGFEVTLGKAGGGATRARVSVTGEPTDQAKIRTMSFDGKKMTAVYDFPPEASLEVQLTATFEGDTAKGMWSARGK